MPLNTTTPSRLFHAKLSASEATLTLIDALTEVPTGERWVCLTVHITNNDTVDRTVLLRFVPDAETGTPGDEHNILPGQAATIVKAGDAKTITGRWSLHAGDIVRGSCSSANKVTVRGDGIRITL